MYPYNPQVAALARRYNPQYQQPQDAPLQRQGAPTTSGQIQPAGLQPQPGQRSLRPQVAALAQQYNPQFNPQMQNMQDQMQNQFNLGLQQTQNQQQQPMNLGYNYAQQFGANPQQLPYGADPNAIAANPQGFQQWLAGKAASMTDPRYNQQPATPGFTPAGQAQNNFLTTPTAQAYPAAMPAQNMPQIPMGSYGGSAAMSQPNYAGYGGGVGGLANLYRTR